MWVKLRVSKVVNHVKRGIGDWVEVGTDLALKWIAAEHAETLNIDSIFQADDIGIVYPPSPKAPMIPYKNIRIKEGGISPLFKRNLFINAPYSITDRDSPDLLKNAGRLAILFDLLNLWDVVLIFASFETNASMVASAEHRRTEAIIHDLRVPFYQSCAIGIRDSEAGREFCSAWSAERAHGTILAPLRAFYQVKPLGYFLPPSWGKKEASV